MVVGWGGVSRTKCYQGVEIGEDKMDLTALSLLVYSSDRGWLSPF